MPARQLQYVTRVPPSQWNLQGVVEARDMERVLLRHAKPGRLNKTLIPVLVGGSVDYTTADYDDFDSPDLTKLELTPDGIHILKHPAGIVVMEGYGYTLPLLVANRLTSAQMLEVTTPWKHYLFPLPDSSTRGYLLNLETFADIGNHEFPFSFGAAGGEATTTLSVDVRPTGTLTVRLLDDAPGPTAARIYLTGSDGLSHMPRGALQRISRLSGEYFFYAETAFSLPMPEGETFIEAVRGIEYAPVLKRVRIERAKETVVDLRLDHVLKPHLSNWYSGDAHIHANLFDNEAVDLEDIHLQVSGEGLVVANLMVSNSDGAILHDERFFEGRPNAISSDFRVLYWNEEMRNRRLYGHMSFFNLESLVHPLYTGFPGTPHWEDYPPNHDQAEKARAQGGAVTYVHPAFGGSILSRVGLAGAREFPVDLVLGQVDALDVVSNTDEIFSAELWYRVLNAGLRCGLSAGSDAFTNIMMHWVPGGGRVYAFVPDGFSYQAWVESYRAGRTMVTNGPFLTLQVNGQGPGQDVKLSAQPSTVTVEVELKSVIPVEKLEIIVNGSPIYTQTLDGRNPESVIHREVTLEKSSWIAARALGPPDRLVMNDTHAFAHTGPVFCILKEHPIRSRQDALFWVEWIDELIQDVQQRGSFATEARKDLVISLFRRAQNKWRDLAHD